MTEVLVDYTQFEPSSLAEQLHTYVLANEDLLRARNMQGVINRYGADTSRGQQNHENGETYHYAVINDQGNVVGSASCFPDLRLRKMHLPLPAGLADHVSSLAETYPYANPNIHAWTDIKEEEVLVGAYKQLAAMADKHRFMNEPHEAPWTIEPLKSPRHIKTALKMAGLIRVATRLFDDGESRRRVPPISSLYVKTTAEYFTAYGRQKEVRKGQWKSGWDEFVEEMDDEEARRISINPRGY
jgi:hypothetical protein